MRAIDADNLLELVKYLEQANGETAESFTNSAGNRSIELDRLKDYINNAETLKCPVCDAKNDRGRRMNNTELIGNLQEVLDELSSPILTYSPGHIEAVRIAIDRIRIEGKETAELKNEITELKKQQVRSNE